MDLDAPSLSFLQTSPPRAFALRLVTLRAGERVTFVAAEWDDALVVVERGTIELECSAGGRRTFAAGAVMFLTGLPLTAIHNPGTVTALLTAVSRDLELEKTT